MEWIRWLEKRFDKVFEKTGIVEYTDEAPGELKPYTDAGRKAKAIAILKSSLKVKECFLLVVVADWKTKQR